MEIPLTLPLWLAAAAPIAVLMFLMLKLQWSAAKAAPAGLGIALLSAFALYKAGPLLVGLEAAKGLWSAAAVLMVVWPAVLIYEVTDQAGAFRVFRAGMQKFTPNELLQVIVVGWVFVSFLQGITGFGVPVAVGAPLLIGLGVRPVWAVVIPLIGHAWGNTFGTLAVAWDALVLQTDLSAQPLTLLRTALWASIFIWIWNVVTGVSICLFYGGMKALKKGAPAVALISLIQGGGQLALSQVDRTLCCFIPCCAALLTALLLGKTRRYNRPWRVEASRLMERGKTGAAESGGPPDMSMNQAFVPYYILTAVTLIVLLISPIKDFLGRFQLGIAFPKTVTGYSYVNPATDAFSPIAPLTHAFTFLLLASALGFFYFVRHGWAKSRDFPAVLRRSVKNTIPSAVAVAAFIMMSRVMGGTGQTVVLARGIAQVLGRGYAVLAPVVGMLGSFMTSSNMASNILFAGFQLTTAKLLNFDPALILGAQTAGGAIGNTICPGNIILGATTAGILGREGIVLRRILPLTLAAAVIVGIILFFALVVF